MSRRGWGASRCSGNFCGVRYNGLEVDRAVHLELVPGAVEVGRGHPREIRGHMAGVSDGRARLSWLMVTLMLTVQQGHSLCTGQPHLGLIGRKWPVWPSASKFREE